MRRNSMPGNVAGIVAPFALLMAAAATAAEPATKPESDLVINLQSVTCAQFANARKYAIPGENPTAERQEMAVTAQDDLVLAMMWVNGYLTGRDGVKVANAFDQDWIVTHMRKLAAICQANSGAMLLSEAAAKL